MTESTECVESYEAGRQLLEQHKKKDVLRMITCGSVDDGKSTLIGRLLLEGGAIYDDQVAILQQDSKRHGTQADEIDPALLLDGLEDERQQGITIDVAYRYFSTAKRKFIVADTPGHEQFTRNMVTGASTANLALILVDATKGILTQTRRHTFIVSMLGIKHIVLVVNKMDLVNYDQGTFEKICNEFESFASALDIPDIRFIPVSALKGDNVAQPSANMLWYEGSSLLHVLENMYVGHGEILREFRLPIQWVNRPNSAFRGYCGTVASGTVQVGDEIVVLPSGKRSRIRQLISWEEDLHEAEPNQSLTVTLEDEIDVARGDMLVRAGDTPTVCREAQAMLVWMSEKPLIPGRRYWAKHTSNHTSAEVTEVTFSVDVNSLRQLPASSLSLNEVGCCRLSFHDPVVIDSYRQNRQTGSMILVDRVSHETVAAGMFLDSDARGEQPWDADPTSLRLIASESRIDRSSRSDAYGHDPFTLLITGLSGSGKTTLAFDLEKHLFELGYKVLVLDGQDMRKGLCRDLGFSAAERSENLRRSAEIARMLNRSGIVCIAAFVAPYSDDHQRLRQMVGSDFFAHIHLTTSLATCRSRDSSGRYEAADRGDIVDFPGVTCDYQPAADADLSLDLETITPDRAVEESLQLLASMQFVTKVDG